MNRSLFYMLATCLMACFAFTSCSDDENSMEDPEIGQEVAEVDEVRYLQNSLVKVDESGFFLYRISGEPLDKADTTKLYLGVKDFTEAQARFRSLFPATTSFEQDGNRMVARLKNNAGTATFNETHDGKEIASVEFDVSPSLHLVSSLHFLYENAWPDNEESMFVEGDVVTLSGKKYVCIRTKGNGNPTLFLHISSSSSRAYDGGHWNLLSNVTFAEANVVRDVLLGDDGKKFVGFQKNFERADTSLKKEEDYWIGELKEPGFLDTTPSYYTFNLASGKVKDYWPKYEFRFWHIFSVNR